MPSAIIKYPFTATITPQTILTVNPARRRLYIQSYGPPDYTDGLSIWVDWSGTGLAVASQCWQLSPGVVWSFGGTDDFVSPLQMRFPSCPTYAITVVTASGTHPGVAYEYT